MTWKEAVRNELGKYQQQTDSDEFTLREFYDFAEDALAAQYPNNNHVRAKIRQVLQRLRDAGEIKFVDGQGNYRVTDNDDATTSSHESIDGELERIRLMNDIEADIGDN